MEAFLQSLRNRYGDISIVGILGRQDNFQSNETIFETEGTFPDESIIINPFDMPAEETPARLTNIRYPHMSMPVSFRRSSVEQTPQPIPFKVSPVNIASSADWIKLRAEVTDIHELTTFFAGKSDSQSPQFMKILNSYLNEVDRVLTPQPEIEDDSSFKFVEALAQVIQKRFYNILKSCRRGVMGKGLMGTEYYRQLKERVGKYFKRMGLKVREVNRHENYRDVEDYVDIVAKKPAPHSFYRGTIAEIDVPPHYFEYHDDTGEIQKYWIHGKCIVYET